MAARSRMKPQYIQYIQYRSVLNAGHALIKTMCIETIFACSDIAFTATHLHSGKTSRSTSAMAHATLTLR